MTASSNVATDTALYPSYGTAGGKAAMMADINNQLRKEPNLMELIHILYRISNTDTSGFSDPTARHDA